MTVWRQLPFGGGEITATATGTPEVGEILHCNAPAGTSLQWMRNGVPIAGQTLSDYEVVEADQGRELTCRASVTSNEFDIPSAALPEMAIISRGQPSTDSAGNNSNYADVFNPGDAPTSFSINLNSVSVPDKSQVRAYWVNQARRPVFNAVNGEAKYGVPLNFVLESHTSTSGVEPSSGWTQLQSVSGNHDAAWISNELDLSNAGWFRIRVTADNGLGVSFEIDLLDVSNGFDDVWVMAGDSNTNQCFNGRRLASGAYVGGSLETYIETLTGRWPPLVFNAGVPFETAGSYLGNWAERVADLPGRFIHYAIGTNDVNQSFVMSDAQLNTVRDNIRTAITLWQEAGKTVALATVPWGNANSNTAVNAAALNTKLAELRAADPTVLAGGDWWGVSNGQHNLVTDGLHFSYDMETQPVTSSHPMGIPNGLCGYEAILRETALKISTIYPT